MTEMIDTPGLSRRSLLRGAGAVAAVGAIGIGTAASATSGATAGPSAGATSGETLKLARVWAVGRP
ncbi:MAG: hypothetical protein H7323_00525, partial [Frankiales bacterium]|nr:hypothetical protein [Frankiales bacterium]